MAISQADTYYIKALDYYPFSLEEALENLNYALSYDGEHAGANCLMGRLYLEQFKDLERAEEYFLAALAHDPRHLDSCEQYCRLLIERRSLEQALKLLRYARSLTGARLAVLLQLEALVQEHRKNYAAAQALLQEALLEAFEEAQMEGLECALRRVQKKARMLQAYVYGES